MTLVRTTVWNGLAIGVRLSTGVVLNKILAVLVGPAGYVVVGQFQNLLQILFNLASGSINTGVTKFTAEFQGAPDDQDRLWATSFKLIFFASCLTGAVMAVFRAPLAIHFLGDGAYASIFLWLAVSIVLYSLNMLLLAVLNGFRDLRSVVISNIAGSLVILVVMSGLTWFLGLYGTLLALTLNQALVFFVTLWLCMRKEWFRPARFLNGFSGATAKTLLVFALMTAASALSINLGQVATRWMLLAELNPAFAGYWDAMSRLSTLNWTFVSASMAFYFLPRMAELHRWPEIRTEIAAGMRFILPVFVAAVTVLYLLREFVVVLLFSRDFLPMTQLFGWQFVGDTFRVASWFFAYVMIGKGMPRSYVATEILSNGMFVLFSWFLVRQIGFQGVAIGHALAYFVTLIGMYAAVRANRKLA